VTRSPSEDASGLAPRGLAPGRGAGPLQPAREEKKAAQRQRILEAAKEVFFRDSFMEANLDEVARRAGVAKGTLYRYFENKAEIYVALLAQNGEIFERRMREAAAEGCGPADRIRQLGRFYREHWVHHWSYFQIFWALENQPVIGALPAPVVDEVTRLWGSCLRILSDVIEGGVAQGVFRRCDPWAIANLLWTAANGLLQSERVEARRALRGRPLEAIFDEMVEVFLRALALPGAASG